MKPTKSHKHYWLIPAAYLAKWEDFQSTYTSEDNTAISEAFNALKLSATDTANAIQTTYDTAIKSAVDKL